MYEIKGIDPKDGKHKSAAGPYGSPGGYLDKLNTLKLAGWKSLGVWKYGVRI